MDVAGNTESTHTSGTIKVDTVKPSTSLTFNPASPNGNNGWYNNASPTFTLDATDATSGVASTSYQIDGGAVHAYSGAVTIPDGVHTITFWSVDNAGNVENTGSSNVKADTVAPTSSIAVSPAAPDGSNSWYVTTPTFTLAGADGLSGLDSLKYQIDGGSTQTYSGAVPIPDGQHTISYWAVDNAGNIEGTHTTATIKVDTARPSTTIAVNPASPNGSGGWYNGSAPTFTLAASDPDPGSGVAATKYQIDAGGVQTYSGAVTIPDGQHTISYWSVDTAGNTETTHTTATIKVDTVKPSTSLLISPLAPNGTNGWYKGAAPTFTLTATDTSGSGVASTSYQIDSGATLPYSGVVTVPEGQHTVSYWSTDAAGNVETTHTTATIKVDVTKPTDTLSFGAATGAFLSGTTIYFKGNATAGSFTLIDTVADTGSGPASATFPATLSAGSPNRWIVTGGGIVSSPAGGPFSALFGWSGGTPATPSPITISSQDGAANVSTGTALSFVNDSTNPTGGALAVNGSSSSTTTTKATFLIGTRTDYTDAGSGLASSVLTVQSETLSGSTCGAPGSGGPFTSPTTITGTTQPAGIVTGFCYLYVLTGTDHVGNVASISLTVTAKTLTITMAHTNGPGHRDGFNGTTNVSSGTVTVRIYAGSTATGTVVATLTDSFIFGGDMVGLDRQRPADQQLDLYRAGDSGRRRGNHQQPADDHLYGKLTPMSSRRNAALATAGAAVLLAAPLATAAKPPAVSIAVSSMKVLDNDTRKVTFKASSKQQLSVFLELRRSRDGSSEPLDRGPAGAHLRRSQDLRRHSRGHDEAGSALEGRAPAGAVGALAAVADAEYGQAVDGSSRRTCRSGRRELR